MKIPSPTHREQVALFRLSVIGDLLARDLLKRGELQAELEERAKKRYRPPGAKQSRTFDWKTLQRWYYEAKRNPNRLLPASRARGYARKLTDEQRDLLLQMRSEHRSAPIELLLSEAVRNGVVAEGAVSESTLARLFREAGLPRISKRRAARRDDVQRRRWQAAKPGDLWHGDVCHVVLPEGTGPRKVMVHGLMDDASRFFTALAARMTEQESDLLEVFCGALLQHPPPKILYLDNGSCYRGDVLALVCQRLGIHLVHAPPYSPENRGKMERVWRTMRQRCTDHLPGHASLHDVDLALWSWLDADYHRRPHASLMGQTPRQRYLAGSDRRPLTAKELAAALEITGRRQVRKDGTFQVESTVYEAAGRHLAGKWITVVTDGLTGGLLRASYQDLPVRFGVCDPVANSRRTRAPVVEDKPTHPVPFDPIAALLQQAREISDE